jgi:hypothetical protein
MLPSAAADAPNLNVTIDSAVSVLALLSWQAYVNITLPSNLLQLNSGENSCKSSADEESIPFV